MLVVEDVVVDFDGLRALDRVSLEVRAGEVLGLIGPNGAGKTTLFNAIAGVVRPESGRILLGGEPIQGRPTHAIVRRGLGRTFQVARPFRDLDVERNVVAGLGVDRYPRIRAFFRRFAPAAGDARTLAERLGLGQRTDVQAGQLPIGLLRRLEAARALAVGPSVILLDEPAAGLTGDEVRELDGIVRELAAEGLAVILVEHNMSFAMRVCDRIVVLAAGEVLAEGPPQGIRENAEVIAAYLGTPA